MNLSNKSHAEILLSHHRVQLGLLDEKPITQTENHGHQAQVGHSVILLEIHAGSHFLDQ